MRRLAISIFLMAVLVGSAFAGDYHAGGTLNCADCHVMHYSQTHGYLPDGGGTWGALGPAGPYDYLLRDEATTLCLECHDGQAFAPDVYAADTPPTVTYGRQAGALNEVGLTEAQSYYDADGHTLGSTDVAPGGTFTNPGGLSCTDCHMQHGLAAYYRNLVNNGTIVTYAIGTNDLLRDVFETSAAAGGDHYDIQNVHFNEPNANDSGYGAWCMGCHTDFHGAAGDANMGGSGGTQWLRHPTASANIGAVGGNHTDLATFAGNPYRLHVMSPTGDWGTYGAAWVGAPNDLTPSCMTCHKAHGNRNAFGLIYATGADNWGENGDGGYIDICNQCHIQGN